MNSKKSSLGHVILVGAGPGDPGLITKKGIQALQRADVVLYDFLTHPNLRLNCSEKAIMTCVGKRKGHHSETQQAIHKLLKTYTDQGKLVIRLKGGDPLIFGRGGEEMAFLTDHGIPFEVIPGVTSAIAVPGSAGIPLTHRHLSRSVAFVTGTLQDGTFLAENPLPEADTLVFLMAITHLKELAAALIKQKRFSRTTPAALIRWGTTADQKTVVGTLDTIYQLHKKEQMGPPSILVVGNVAQLATSFNWKEALPLRGKRVVVCRTKEQGEPVVDALENLGAEVLHIPLIQIKPILSVRKKLTKRWLSTFSTLLFTSANGVNQFFDTLLGKKIDSRNLYKKQIVAIGPKTKEVLKSRGVIADHIPIKFNTKGLLESLEKDLSTETILIPTAKGTSVELSKELTKRGATVEVWPLYNTICPKIEPHLQLKNDDIILFTSGSTARHFFESTLYTKQELVICCIGMSTSEVVKDYYRGPVHVARSETLEDIINIIVHVKKQ